MSVCAGRCSARLVLRELSIPPLAAFLVLNFVFFAPSLRAVVVRGLVTDALGKPIPAARVQLIQGPKVVAVGIAGPDGAYEIRYADAGRFVLLTSAATFIQPS